MVGCACLRGGSNAAWDAFDDGVYETWPAACDAFETYLVQYQGSQEQDELFANAKYVKIRDVVAGHHADFLTWHRQTESRVDVLRMEVERHPPRGYCRMPKWQKQDMLDVFAEHERWLEYLYGALALVDENRAKLWKIVEPFQPRNLKQSYDASVSGRKQAKGMKGRGRGATGGTMIGVGAGVGLTPEEKELLKDITAVTHPALSLIEVSKVNDVQVMKQVAFPTLRTSLAESVLIVADCYRQMIMDYLKTAPAPGGAVVMPLQLPALSAYSLSRNRSRGAFLADAVLPQVCVTGIAMAMMRLSVSQLAVVKKRQGEVGKIQLVVLASDANNIVVPGGKKAGKSVAPVDYGEQFNTVLSNKRALLKNPLVLGPEWGAVTDGGRWLRQSNTKEDRCRRLMEVGRTLQALWSGGYCAPATGELKKLEFPAACAEKTAVWEVGPELLTKMEAEELLSPDKISLARKTFGISAASAAAGPAPVAPLSATATPPAAAAPPAGKAPFSNTGVTEGTSTTASEQDKKAVKRAACGGCCGSKDETEAEKASALKGRKADVPSIEALSKLSISTLDNGGKKKAEADVDPALEIEVNDPASTTVDATDGEIRGAFEILGGPPKPGTTAMDIARKKALSGKRTVALNAAAAYKLGGGALTGGRHALEESWCATSTLLKSLLHAQFLVENDMPRGRPTAGAGAGETPEHRRYFPNYGAVASPQVEIFRESIFGNYRFLERGPVALAGVVSIAAFNCNPGVRDAPIDAPATPSEFRLGLQKKWFVALCAAALMKAEVVVVPDVGCGVFKNPAQEVGLAFSSVYEQFFKGSFHQIVLLGNVAFCENAASGAGAGAWA
eukprot:g4204.t1